MPTFDATPTYRHFSTCLTSERSRYLDPESWDDSNDSHYLALYREKMDLKSVLVLCFTQANETYHHWPVFANGSSGVGIQIQACRTTRNRKSTAEH